MSTPSAGGPSEMQQQLNGVAATLGAISALIGSVGLTAAAAAQASAEVRREVAKAGQTIEQAVRMVEDGGHHHGPHFRIVDVLPDIASVHLDHAVLPHHQPLDVIIDVRASAQVAGLVLSFGANELFQTTTLRITGGRGTSEITVVSGATVDHLANALWSVYAWTGVAPFSTGTGVHLLGDSFGHGAFVSVRLLHPTHAPGATGIYRLDARDFYRADPDSRIPWESTQAFDGVTDLGQDLQALINGRPALGRGLSLSLWSPQLRLQTSLQTTQDPWPGHAFTLGPFRAFRILRD